MFGHAGVRDPPQSFVRRGQYKLVRFQHRRDAKRFGALALYDLEADPGETRNAILEHPVVAERLRQELDAFLAENWKTAPGSGTPVPFDPLERKLLRQLGYAD